MPYRSSGSCISIRTRCLLSGYAQMIWAVISIILEAVSKVTGATAGFSIDINPDVGFWPILILDVLKFLVSFCLLFGVHRHIRRCVWMFLIGAVVLLLLRILFTLVAALFFDIPILNISATIIRWGVYLGLILVVYQFFLEMDNDIELQTGNPSQFPQPPSDSQTTYPIRKAQPPPDFHTTYPSQFPQPPSDSQTTYSIQKAQPPPDFHTTYPSQTAPPPPGFQTTFPSEISQPPPDFQTNYPIQKAQPPPVSYI